MELLLWLSFVSFVVEFVLGLTGRPLWLAKVSFLALGLALLVLALIIGYKGPIVVGD